MSAGRSTFTILGAGGFIGGTLVAWLESQEQVVHPVTRASLPALLAARRPAGHVIDCVGLNGGLHYYSLDSVEAHVGLVGRCLAQLSFESFLLLSSCRVYAHAEATHEEAVLPQNPADPSELYNVTKLAGEALCLADPRPTIRVVRLSNVYGAAMPIKTFLGNVLNEGRTTGSVVFRQGPATEKDYINIGTVVRLLPEIAKAGRARIYNVAFGRNTSHAEIAGALQEIAGWRTAFAPDAPTMRYRPIDTSRLCSEFGTVAGDLLTDLPALLAVAPDDRRWMKRKVA
jgi:nucleoside-diphosphate-sugar epimerase